MILYIVLFLIVMCLGWRWWVKRCQKPIAPGKGAIIMLATPDIETYAMHTREINAAYAAKHGYAFHYCDHLLDASVHPVWNKVLIMLDYVDRYDWVLWIDADACFIKHDIPLDKWLQLPYDMLICDDLDASGGKTVANTGVFLVKRTEWSRAFIHAWWDMRTKKQYTEFPREQQAFHDMYTSDFMGAKEHVAILPADELNSSWHKIYTKKYDNLFVVHLMATDEQTRIDTFKAFQEKLGL